MNRSEFFKKKNEGALWDVGVSMKRTNPLPLDKDSIFESLSDAETYAAGSLAYPGQVIAVVDENATTMYYLAYNIYNTALELKEFSTGSGSGSSGNEIHFVEDL